MKPITLRERLVTFCTFTVAALCIACDDYPPLSIGEIKNCITPDTGIAVPVDTALYTIEAKRCLRARGNLK